MSSENIIRQLKFVTISFIVGSVVAFIIFFITYMIAYSVSPPVSIDYETGEIHPTQPFGQIMLAMLIASIFGLLSILVTYKQLKKRFVKQKQLIY